jgi:hypothetical protein
MHSIQYENIRVKMFNDQSLFEYVKTLRKKTNRKNPYKQKYSEISSQKKTCTPNEP